MSAVLLIAAIAALGAYACRMDGLHWWQHPIQLLGHVAGAACAAWALRGAGMSSDMATTPGGDAFAALAVSVAWLAASYQHHAPVAYAPSNHGGND